MSETVRDLLVRGVAAARSNEKEEGIHYLEWVLSRSDADYDQQAEANLWLSRLTDDRAQQRDYLENVLAVFPGHTEARRSLAILDGKLDPADIIDQQHPAVALGPTAVDMQVRRYTCPSCGGKTAFDPGQQALQCLYCGSKLSEANADGAKVAVEEQDFLSALAKAGGHRWQLPAEILQACSGCGATITLAPGQLTSNCLFCGSAHVGIIEARRDLISPTGVVPFAFDADGALERMRSWLQSQRFRDGDLEYGAWFLRPQPVYLPFWTFDIDVSVAWQGTVVEQDFGRRRHPRKVESSMFELFDDLLVPAGRHLPLDVMSRIADYQTNDPTPYSPDLLAAWPAEIYHVSLADASLDAHALARNVTEQRARASDDVAGVQQLAFGPYKVSVNSYKLLLLPVWIGGLEFEDQHYPLAINGQTGTIAGSVPRNMVQNIMSRLFRAR